MPAPSGSFVWYEHVSNDIAAARAFYESLFGWQTEAMQTGAVEPYQVIHNAGAGIGGYATASAGAPSQWLSYLAVDDVDASYKAALAAGAQSLVAPADVGSAGRSATLAGPTGGVFAIWKGTSGGDTPPNGETPVGGWFWNELTTQDDAAALAFYEKVFGFSHDTMAMPNGGNYHVLKQGDAMRGGIAQASDASMPTMWLPYVKVADCDASAAKAQGLGSTIVMPGTDIAGVGRFAVFIDPQGAALAVMQMPS